MISAEYVYSAGLSSQLLACEKPEVVFSGRSNVGKSSLINRLTGRKSLARVSSKPGKTATINFFDAGAFSLVDLPGYGYAKVSRSEKLRWAQLVEGYFAAGRDIRLVVQIVDMRHPLSVDDRSMIDFLYQSGVPFIIVMTKSDKLNKTEYAAQLERFQTELSEYHQVALFPFSALKGDGLDPILCAIDSAVNH